MKVAYFGGDWFLSCINAWQSLGHEITHVFVAGEEPYNKQLRQWSNSQQLRLIKDKPTSRHMQELHNDSVDCLFCVEYPWLIPTEHHDFKTINVHPSMLPHGKGPTPVSWIVHSKQEHAGISFHKLADTFDSGDIIYQKPIAVSDEDTLDTLLAKLELEVPGALTELLLDFQQLYAASTPQTEGSYWPQITLNDRQIRWQSSCQTVRQQIKSAGQFGVAVAINKELLLVRHMQCVEYTHSLKPGIVFKEDDRFYHITLADGLCVIDKSCILERQTLNIE